LIRRSSAGRGGFTLIEVLAAMIIFSAGLVMMLSLTEALGDSLEHSAINTLVTARGQQTMDSLGGVAYSSLTVQTRTDTLTFRSVRYSRAQIVTQYSPLVKKIVVTITPLSGSGTGPDYNATSYLADSW
jgi:prepilin-type N-terminal cleavage/methylation domain-containing protein